MIGKSEEDINGWQPAHVGVGYVSDFASPRI